MPEEGQAALGRFQPQRRRFLCHRETHCVPRVGNCEFAYLIKNDTELQLTTPIHESSISLQPCHDPKAQLVYYGPFEENMGRESIIEATPCI